jgi:hypothetical protein
MMKTIKISTPNGASAGHSAQITTEDGHPIDGVLAVRINMLPNSVITADVTLAVHLCDIKAHPLLSLETVREAAARHGYDLAAKPMLAQATIGRAYLHHAKGG